MAVAVGCGGKKPLTEACEEKGLDLDTVLEQLAGELAGLGARRPLLLTDKGVSGTGLATLLAEVASGDKSAFAKLYGLTSRKLATWWRRRAKALWA